MNIYLNHFVDINSKEKEKQAEENRTGEERGDAAVSLVSLNRNSASSAVYLSFRELNICTARSG